MLRAVQQRRPAARNTLDSARIPRASKLLICGLSQKGRVLAQDGVQTGEVGPESTSGRAGFPCRTTAYDIFGYGNSFAMMTVSAVQSVSRSTAAAPLRSAAGRRQTFFLPRLLYFSSARRAAASTLRATAPPR